ncbi:O(6)-methylguanine-induced apoptosis 2-like [Hydractinia symbiolongicarpus]|uniref:O(6)-methylguanine-induced apoptosis 2-like n=1 Tax=Hydractinia symbiolongicarpus TaxID=13093 RepID=UPI00254F9AD4|nr:O(6)-methylguanine-induced apoptosis 2-like [Hydractinia symbiolongicarpus]
MAAVDGIQQIARKGCLHKVQGKVATSASIPSKYQTIVLNNNERKGFNSGSKRFDCLQFDESPGPAKYDTTQTLLKENSTSYSTKGLGGFVSKVKRFPVALNANNPVGPGQYSPNLTTEHDFNKATCTSNFHKPIAVQSRFEKFQTPAPNHYNLSSKTMGKGKPRESAAFLSRTKRELVTTKISQSVPAPGAYEVSDKWTSSAPRAAQAPFKSTTTRTLLPKNVYENPGPGTYDPHEPVKNHPEKRGLPRKHYLCISAPAVPMPQQQPTPGPGQYNLVNYEGLTKQYVSSSMFVSTTNRWSGDRPKAGPGPGAYNPRHHNKQSFMYNAAQKWI